MPRQAFSRSDARFPHLIQSLLGIYIHQYEAICAADVRNSAIYMLDHNLEAPYPHIHNLYYDYYL